MLTPKIVYVSLCQLRFSRFRHIETYPIRRAKVEALKESLKTIGLLPRLIARLIKEGYELAYGAHLLTALLELHGPDYKVHIQVQDISDEQMLQMMARENLEQWGSDPLVELETVAAVLEAEANGQIKLKKLRSSEKIVGEALGQFLGWLKPSGYPQEKVYAHIKALDLIKRGLLKRSDLEDLSGVQYLEFIREITAREAARERDAQAAEQQAKKAELAASQATDAAAREALERRKRTEQERAHQYREHSKKETKTIVERVGPQLREHKIGARQVREKASELVEPPFRAKRQLPDLGAGAQAIARQLDAILGLNDDRRGKILEIIDWRDQLPRLYKKLLLESLRSLSERANKLADALDQPINRGNGQPKKSAGPRQLKA